jgi:thiamine biosynthesis lipoprotein
MFFGIPSHGKRPALSFGASSLAVHASKLARTAARPAEVPGWFAREEAIMGTAIRVELWCEGRSEAMAAADAVMAEMHRIDRTMSPHKPGSELSRVNLRAAAAPVVLSDEMYHLVERALHFSRLSGGAFDISYASVGHLYDYRQRIRPDDEAIARAREAMGYQHLILDAQARSLRFARPGMRIDLGGFAKGHAADNAASILTRRGIRHAIVSAGGDSRVIGDRRGRPWTVAIRDPRRQAVAAMLPLTDVSISTSGDYERYFEQDGVRWHHLIDPRTGKSPNSVHSVTILAEDGLTSEALSKSVFVLGMDQGMRLVEDLPGVDAVVIDAQGQLHFSTGLGSGAAPLLQ